MEEEGDESKSAPRGTKPEIRPQGFWLGLSILVFCCPVLMVGAFLALLPRRFALPFLALPTAGLLCLSAEGLQPTEALGFPGFKVSLNAARRALGHVAVPFGTSHDTAGTEHPQPPGNVSSHLGQDKGEREIKESPT